MKSLHIVAPVLALVLFLSPFALEAAKTEIPDLRIVGVTDKTPTSYAVGDEITFTLKLAGVKELSGPMTLRWNIWGDGGFAESGEVPAALDKPLVLKAKATKPGSFRVYAGLFDANGPVTSPDRGKARKVQWFGGAGVAWEKLERAPEPADFDAFWAKQKARLAAEPLKVTRKQVASAPHDTVNDCWEISIACPGGRDLHGYLTIPKTWKDGKKFDYAEVVTCSLGLHRPQKPHIGTQSICLNINSAGQLVGAKESDWKAYDKTLKGADGKYRMFDDAVNAKPEDSEFLAIALRLMRAFEFLKTLPEWSGRTLGVWGEGMQAVYGAALVEGMNGVVSASTAFPADFSGPSFGRMSAESQPLAWRPELGYFDPVNLAKRVPATCKVKFENVYLGAFPPVPAAIDAVYRNLKGPKSIQFVQGTRPGSFTARAEDAVTFSSEPTAWKEVWRDDFEGPALNEKDWSRIGPGRSDWNRHMSERPDLVELKDGKLVLWGKRNSDTNADPRPFLTGGVWTKHKRLFSRGRIEVCAKFEDHQKGAWPAFWTVGDAASGDKRGWPWNGEIDIVERLNGDDFVYHTAHSAWTVKKGQGKNPPQGGKGKIRQGEYNVFGLEIAPDALIWFVNGQETFRYPRTGADELQWPFEIPQHLKLDQQLGGKWVGEVAVETLPVATYVDWVRYLVPEEGR